MWNFFHTYTHTSSLCSQLIPSNTLACSSLAIFCSWSAPVWPLTLLVPAPTRARMIFALCTCLIVRVLAPGGDRGISQQREATHHLYLLACSLLPSSLAGHHHRPWHIAVVFRHLYDRGCVSLLYESVSCSAVLWLAISSFSFGNICFTLASSHLCFLFAAYAMGCLVQLASIRRTLFSNQQVIVIYIWQRNYFFKSHRAVHPRISYVPLAYRIPG